MTRTKSSGQSAFVATPGGNISEKTWLYAGISVNLGLLICGIMRTKMSDNVTSAGNQQERLQKLSADYVVALIDGEGYFSVSIFMDKSKNYISRRAKLVFGIKLKEADGEILFRLKETFNCGSIFKRVETRPNLSNCLEYQVRNFDDIKNIIIPFFDRNKLQMKTKRFSFINFSHLAELFESKIHLTEKGFLKMKNLAQNAHM